MTYIIKKNGRRYGKKVFDAYESARSYIRKVLRTLKDHNLVMSGYGHDNGWIEHNNPSHSRYGFSIERKEANVDKTGY
jgi:DNA-binding IscR family transcriptional regulator